MADVILDNVTINQPVADETALAAIPTGSLDEGCIVEVNSTKRLYRWNGSAWQYFTLPYDLSTLPAITSIAASQIFDLQDTGGVHKYATISQLSTYVSNLYAGSARYNGSTNTLIFSRGCISSVTKIQQGIYQFNLIGLPDANYACTLSVGLGSSLGIDDNALLYRIDQPYFLSTSITFGVVNLADNTFVDADTVCVNIS